MNDKEKNICILLKRLIDHFYLREQTLKNAIKPINGDPDKNLSFQLIDRIEFVQDSFPKISLILSQIGITEEDFLIAIGDYAIKMKERDQIYWKQEFADVKIPDEEK